MMNAVAFAMCITAWFYSTTGPAGAVLLFAGLLNGACLLAREK